MGIDCSWAGTAECGACEFRDQRPEGCRGDCEPCLLLPCPCVRTMSRGGQSSYEVVHGEREAETKKEAKVAKPTAKLCEQCGEVYSPRRRDQKYCSDCSKTKPWLKKGRKPKKAKPKDPVGNPTTAVQVATRAEVMENPKQEPENILVYGVVMGAGYMAFLGAIAYAVDPLLAIGMFLGTGIGATAVIRAQEELR